MACELRGWPRRLVSRTEAPSEKSSASYTCPIAYCLKIRRTIAARSGSGIKLSRIARDAFR